MSDPTLPYRTVTEEPYPRRPLNTTPLVVGLILLGLSGLWWADELDLVPSGSAVYVLPALLITAGVIGLAAFLLRGRGRHPEDPRHPTTTSATTTVTEDDHA